MNVGSTHSLGSLLIHYHLISEAQLQEALEEQKRSRGRLGETLVRLGYLKEDVLTWCLANQLNIPCVTTIDTRPDHLDLPALDRLTPELAHRHHVIPLLLSGDELTVVTDDPLDKEALGEIERATGLRLNVAAGPPSEIMSALELLYGPDPEADTREAPAPVLAVSTNPRLAPSEMLAAWLDRTREGGFQRLILEPRDGGGQVRMRSRSNQVTEKLSAELLSALIDALKEVSGISRISVPVLRPFSFADHEGTVALGQTARGPIAVVALEAGVSPLRWPAEWSAALKAAVRGPGLWLLGVSLEALWRPTVRAVTEALEPDRRVLCPAGDGWGDGDGGRDITVPMLDGCLGLEPDLLVLPAAARGAVMERLRGGMPETSIMMQVAARSPLRALQILRSSGLTGPEMAELVRGVVCVSTIEPVCEACQLEQRQAGAASVRVVSGGGGPVAISSIGEVSFHACLDGGVSGELPVMAWSIPTAAFMAVVADDPPLSSVKSLLARGPIPDPGSQIRKYHQDGLISDATARTCLEAWID